MTIGAKRLADKQARDAEFERILSMAHDAAKSAQAGMVEGTGLDCGFAWVTLGGNEPLSRYCREKATALGKQSTRATYALEQRYGSRMMDGWTWWKPGSYAGQSIGIHEAGARAFRDMLAQFGISATMGSRFD